MSQPSQSSFLDDEVHSLWFKVMTGVRQGCLLSPVLALAIDWVVRTAVTGLDVGLQWTDGSRLNDLDYTLMIFSTRNGESNQD